MALSPDACELPSSIELMMSIVSATTTTVPAKPFGATSGGHIEAQSAAFHITVPQLHDITGDPYCEFWPDEDTWNKGPPASENDTLTCLVIYRDREARRHLDHGFGYLCLVLRASRQETGSQVQYERIGVVYASSYRAIVTKQQNFRII